MAVGPVRVGVLGGTFDPPHIGHLVMAIAVLEDLELDVVTLVVAGDPWQKSGSSQVTAADDRLAMTRAAVAGIDRLEVSDIEIRRGGPTYTVETLEELHAVCPDARLHWILGADALAGLSTWHRHAELTDLATLVVVDRPGTAFSVPEGTGMTFVEAPRLDVSSTELRARAADGRSLAFLVPDGAIAVIEERGLYSWGR